MAEQMKRSMMTMRGSTVIDKKQRKQMKKTLVAAIKQSDTQTWIDGYVPENYEELMADAALAVLFAIEDVQTFLKSGGQR